MEDLNDYFGRHGWPKTRDEAAKAKEVVEAAANLKELREKCERMSMSLQQVRFLLRANKYDEAVQRIKTIGDGT